MVETAFEINRLISIHTNELRNSYTIEEVKYHQGFLNALDAIRETLK